MARDVLGDDRLMSELPHMHLELRMLDRLKQHYWRVLRRYDRWRRPQQISLSPHDWMDAIVRQVVAHRAGCDPAAPLVYVDGGAHDGQMARRFAERFAHLHVHAFEPNADLLPRLRDNLRDLPGSINAEALGEQPGSATMFINQSPMTSSLLPAAELSHRCFGRHAALRETRRIDVTSLDHWADAQGIERIDILKLDLQGYEQQALRGARRLLGRSRAVVVLEVNFAPFYEGCSLFSDVDVVLRDCGYSLYNLYHLCTHLPAGHIGSCDAIFLPHASAQALTLRKAA